MSCKKESTGDNSEDAASQSEDGAATEPLATTRSRRANAGNRMGYMIQDEADDFYANLYGGFEEEEDDADFEDEGQAENEDVGDGSDSGSESDSSSGSESGSDSSPEDEMKNSVKTENCKLRIDPDAGATNLPTKSAYKVCAKICSVCLGEDSQEDDEIIDCDSCGVSVHESCYGVTSEDVDDNVSANSHLSSESTEPWFCEPCKRSVMNPHCELCPNLGGIFKQTDSGRWIHMVCALYTRGVTFEDVENLTEVSLFELNYALYGSKTCTICEDRRLARSGICIGCDAGLCKVFFHATCAQKEGFLFESHSDEVDPYFAQCRQHADKTVIKRKKRLYTALHARLRQTNSTDSRSDRIKEKLAEITAAPDPHLSKWTPENPPPIPVRVVRNFLTSPSLILRLTKKSELLGFDVKSAFMNVQDELETARQKWHIPPAFNLEFVAYCNDRTSRMVDMRDQNIELVKQNSILKTDEAKLRDKFNSMKVQANELRAETESLIREIRNIQKSITSHNGKQYNLPHHVEQQIARCKNVRSITSDIKSSNGANKSSSTFCCGICKTEKDQHLLALCDTCHSYLHIYCLDPPLTRVPKKTKFGGWQCSDCSEKIEDEEEEAQEEQNTLTIQDAEGPRKLRGQIKYPEKYIDESMLATDFWSNKRRRSKKRSSPKSKKIKTEN